MLGIVSIFEGEILFESLISQLCMTKRTCHGRLRQTYLFGFCKVPIWHKAVLVMFSEWRIDVQCLWSIFIDRLRWKPQLWDAPTVSRDARYNLENHCPTCIQNKLSSANTRAYYTQAFLRHAPGAWFSNAPSGKRASRPTLLALVQDRYGTRGKIWGYELCEHAWDQKREGFHVLCHLS